MLIIKCITVIITDYDITMRVRKMMFGPPLQNTKKDFNLLVLKSISGPHFYDLHPFWKRLCRR